MKELLTYIVQSLVDDPAQVSVTERKADGEIIFVKQIRILMRAVAQRKGKKVSVEIMD